MKILDRIKQAFRPVPMPPAETTEIKTTRAGSGITAKASGIGYNSQSYGSGAKWPLGTSASNLVTIHDHLSLRQASRDAMYDSMEARALVESFQDNVVETGLRAKPTPDYDVLGISPEAAEEWAENVGQEFHRWAKSKKCNRSETVNLYQAQRLYAGWQHRDNDMFTRLYYSRNKSLLNPLQFDFVDPNQIRGYSSTSTYIQNTSDDGIVRDDAGKEIGYIIWYYDAITGGYKEMFVPAVGEKSGRIMMLHGYAPEYAGQGRGYPRLSHLIQELENLTDFKASTIKKAIAQSSFIAAVENDVQDASNPLEGLPAGPIREYGTYPEDDTATSGTLEAEAPIKWDMIPEATIRPPGSALIGNLRRGDKLKYLQDTSPAQGYEAFEKSFYSAICASTGTSFEFVRKQFEDSFSATRGALVLIYRVMNIWRDEIAADWLDPIYEMWLSEEIAAGRISAPGWNDPRLRAAWLSCEWAGAPMPNIDPLKSAAADEKYVALGAQTLDDVARNYNGSSGKANRVKNKRQYEELPEPPFPYAPRPSAASIPPAPAPDMKPVKKAVQAIEQLTLDFSAGQAAIMDSVQKNNLSLRAEMSRELNKPAPVQAPDNITIPVDIKVNIERDAEKKQAKQVIKLKHDEKGHLIGAESEEINGD